MEATLIQSYLGSLEAYFEAFPQLIIASFFLVISIESNTNKSSTDFIVVIFSALLSLISVAQKAVKEDMRYFKRDSNIRGLEINSNFDTDFCGKKICCVNWKYINHILYRYCDVFIHVSALSVMWAASVDADEQGNVSGRASAGYGVVVLLAFDFIASIIISSIDRNVLSFELTSCIAVIPLVTNNQKCSSILAFWWRLLVNLLLIWSCSIIRFAYTDVINHYSYIVWAITPYVIIMSMIYFCESVCNCTCCNVLKQYGIKSITFEGIENSEELQELFQFNYVIKPNHITNGDFTIISDIPVVYDVIMDNIKESDKEIFIQKWKNINNKRKGNLLHQVCRNNYIENVNETLDFVINILEYDINEQYGKSSLTPLMICSMCQNNDEMIKLLINEYKVDIDILDKDGNNALYYVKKYNKSSSKSDIISLLENKTQLLI
eukprot:25054_1